MQFIRDKIKLWNYELLRKRKNTNNKYKYLTGTEEVVCIYFGINKLFKELTCG